jgi:hypothetical protein
MHMHRAYRPWSTAEQEPAPGCAAAWSLMLTWLVLSVAQPSEVELSSFKGAPVKESRPTPRHVHELQCQEKTDGQREQPIHTNGDKCGAVLKAQGTLGLNADEHIRERLHAHESVRDNRLRVRRQRDRCNDKAGEHDCCERRPHLRVDEKSTREQLAN